MMDALAFSPLTTRNVLLELIEREIAFAACRQTRRHLAEAELAWWTRR